MILMKGKKVIDLEGAEGSTEEEFEGGREAAGGSVGDHARHADDRTRVGALGRGGGVGEAPTGGFAGAEEELVLRRNQVVELWARLKACDDKRRQYKEEAKENGRRLRKSEALSTSLADRCAELEGQLALQEQLHPNSNLNNDSLQLSIESTKVHARECGQVAESGTPVSSRSNNEDVARAHSQVAGLTRALLELRSQTAHVLADKDQTIAELQTRLSLFCMPPEDEKELLAIKDAVQAANASFQSLFQKWGAVETQHLAHGEGHGRGEGGGVTLLHGTGGTSGGSDNVVSP